MKTALALIVSLLAAPVALAQTVPDACPVRADTVVANYGLGRARAAVAQGRLTILALGSSSIQGHGASRPELAFVPLLEAGLEQRLPGVDVAVINRGIGGETAKDTADRMEREVADHPADLVIWQLGTNDMLRDRWMEHVIADLRRGQAILNAADVDVMLLDPQRLPEDTADPNFKGRNPGLEAVALRLADEAAAAHYAMARRYQPMGDWMGLPHGGVGPDDLHLNDEGYACWSANTAEGLAAALR